MGEPIKLLVVEDSQLIRRAVCRIFESDEHLQVIGEADNGRQALDLLKKIDPDVITLDVHMPEMDGISTLKRIMVQRPKPTVMLSNVTLEGARVTFDTLKYGAVDFISKPSNLGEVLTDVQQREISRRIKMAAGVQMESIRYVRIRNNCGSPQNAVAAECRYLVAVGAAEGGYGALLKTVPHIDVGIPAAFLAILDADAAYRDAFATYLNDCSRLAVKRTLDGDIVKAGTCYLASGSEYVTLQPENGQFRMIVHPSPFEEQRGAINMTMFSVAEIMRENSVGVILTGSGEDGIEGAGEIHRNKGQVLLQHPDACLYKQTVRGVLERFPQSRVLREAEMIKAINQLSDT